MDARFDLDASAGGRAPHLRGYAGELGKPVVADDPLEPERRELMAQRCLVEATGGLGLPVQLTPVESGVTAISTAGDVGDEDVGVQLRVTGPAGPVPERGSDESSPAEPGVTVTATANLAGFA